MAEQKIIKESSVEELFKRIRAGGRRILAPVNNKGTLLFKEVDTYDAVACDYIQTSLSAKEAVVPRCEEILRYRTEQNRVFIEQAGNRPVPTVVFGVRPCDARSFTVLNAVYTADHPDALYKSKIESTTIIGISCSESDEYCFCTSVGGAPGDIAGSDILLTKIEGESYLAEVLTEKGKALITMAPELFAPAGNEDKDKHLARVKRQFDLDKLVKKLPGMFDASIWIDQSLRCLGCGACSYACPACSCFDIQDETEGSDGLRLRCWDSCGFGQFTLHTSGHNPRGVQSQRWRQRIMHKFSYQPDQLKVVGCVGCGRCSRACPADMNILHQIKDILEAQ
jgi:formate hydrogenlyase subunit 6/NADH:ubiquinone oxidoreductase subunit I